MKRIKFYIDTMLGSGSNGLLTWLAVVSFAFVFVVSVLTWLVGMGDYENFGDLLWDFTMRALMPESIDAGAGSVGYLLTLLLLTLFGIFVLSILISFLSTIIDARVREVAQGLQPFPFGGHTVILGWSSRVPAIVEELVLANESEENSRLVIVSNLEHEELETSVKRYIGATKNTRLFWRSRKLDSFKTFDNLNIKGAKRIVVLGDEADETLHLARLKATISLYNYFDQAGLPAPGILVEASDESEASSLMSGSKGRAIPVIVSDLPARLIVETTFQPNLPTVYEELLSFEGNEIYVSGTADSLGLTGMNFRTASAQFPTCIPIGIITGDEQVVINPDEDRILDASHALVVIAEDDSLIKVVQNSDPLDSAGHDVRFPISNAENGARKQNVTLVGYSHSTPEIVDKLVQTGRCNLTLVIDDAERVDAVTRSLLDEGHAAVREASMTDAKMLTSESVTKADTVIISNFSSDQPGNSDLEIMRSILMMNQQLESSDGPHIIAELNASDSRDMMAELFDLDFVVSDKIGSKIFAQYVENPHLIQVIDSLVCSGSHRIIIHQLADDLVSGVNFGTLRQMAQANGRILIGVRIVDNQSTMSMINPSNATIIPATATLVEGVFIE
jgi:hypothetical protein